MSRCHRFQINSCFLCCTQIVASRGPPSKKNNPKKPKQAHNAPSKLIVRCSIHSIYVCLRILTCQWFLDETAEQVRCLAAGCRRSSFGEEASSYETGGICCAFYSLSVISAVTTTHKDKKSPKTHLTCLCGMMSSTLTLASTCLCWIPLVCCTLNIFSFPSLHRLVDKDTSGLFAVLPWQQAYLSGISGVLVAQLCNVRVILI